MTEHLINLLLGPTAALVLSLVIIYGGWRRWWVFGWVYKDIVKEKDEWKEAALRGTRVAERAVSLHEKRDAKDA